jgi:hypothetical protein
MAPIGGGFGAELELGVPRIAVTGGTEKQWSSAARRFF